MARKKNSKESENRDNEPKGSIMISGVSLTTLKSDTVKTVKNSMEPKKVSNIAGRAYFNHIVSGIIDDVAGDNIFMEYIMSQISQRVKSQQDELFNIRVVKLIKREIINMFRKQIMELMSHQKIELQDFLDEEQKKLESG